MEAHWLTWWEMLANRWPWVRVHCLRQGTIFIFRHESRFSVKHRVGLGVNSKRHLMHLWPLNGPNIRRKRSIETYQNGEAFTRNVRKTNLTCRRVDHSRPVVFAELSRMLLHLWQKKHIHILWRFPQNKLSKQRTATQPSGSVYFKPFERKTHFPRCAT